MISSIFSIIASILGLVVTYLIGNKLTQLVQAYRNGQQAKDTEAARAQTQAEDQKANRDSDQLKQIDGR